MNDFEKIQAALGRVRDVHINPETGKKTLLSNKSLLEKSGTKITEDQKELIKENIKNDKSKYKATNDYINSYFDLINIKRPNQEPEVQNNTINETNSASKPTSPLIDQPIEVIKTPHQKEFMDTIVKAINRRR